MKIVAIFLIVLAMALGGLPVYAQQLDNVPPYGELPSSLDLSSGFPVPGEQQKNSCAAWAVTYAKTYLESQENSWQAHDVNKRFSAAFVYSYIHFDEQNDKPDSGGSIIGALDVIKNIGICFEASFPNNDFNYLNKPDVIPQETSNYRIYDYSLIDPYSDRVEMVKQELYENRPVIIGVPGNDTLRSVAMNNPEYVYNSVEGWGNSNNDSNGTNRHTMCIVGYDDNKLVDAASRTYGAFKYINSWGADWCDGGYGYISYDVVENDTIAKDDIWIFQIDDSGKWILNGGYWKFRKADGTLAQGPTRINNRPPRQLISFKIQDSADQGHTQSKPFAPVAILVGCDFKNLHLCIDVFNQNTFA